ncbi:MAG: S8 family serine peptidase [Methanospirillaceae archaeon]|nr:S8 family serine peptidase [Methanospirillaceae archaeon]
MIRFLVLVLTGTMILFLPGCADTLSGTFSEERLVIHYNPSYPVLPNISGIDTESLHPSLHLISTCEPLSFAVVGLSGNNTGSVYEMLSTLPFITDIEPDPKRYACNDTAPQAEETKMISLPGRPDDPRYPNQWSIPATNVPGIWNYREKSDVVVSIIDSGIDYRNADITGQYTPGGYDWFGGDTDPYDWDGHGTHLAGIVSATTDNRIGMSGIANISLMSERIYSDSYTTYASLAACAVVHAADAGADIILLGYGGETESRAESKAIGYAAQKGCVIIAPAGNSNTNMPHYPSDLQPVISVGSSSRNGERSSFSNYGIYLEIMAPGEEIISMHPGNRYAYQSGTSQAAAVTAGIAALLYSRFPDISADVLRSSLDATAGKKDDSERTIYYGYGLIDALAAYQWIGNEEEKNSVQENQTFSVQTHNVPNKTKPDTIKPAGNQTIILENGWNCISFPATPSGNETAFDLFSTVHTDGHTIWRYETGPEDAGWHSITKSSLIKPLEGIFVYSASRKNLTYSVPQTSIPERELYSGWNTVGTPAYEPTPVREAFLSVKDNWVTLLALNVSSGYFDTAIVNGGDGFFSDSFLTEPHRGYWIYMQNDGILVPPGSMFHPKPDPDDDEIVPPESDPQSDPGSEF